MKSLLSQNESNDPRLANTDFYKVQGRDGMSASYARQYQ